MNDATKTIAAIVVAAGLAAAAYSTAPKPVTSAAFSDQGEEFFPSFKDPLAAKSLEVISYDEPTASISPFKVSFDGKRWVIPSHNNYPADAETNMAKAASAFVGLKKDQVVSDKTSDFQTLGVLEPDDDKASLSGRGTRVTLKDGGGAVLADLILGKPVEKSSVGGMVYARQPGKNRVYAVRFTSTITTKFGDWVQTDALRLGGAQVNSLKIDRYKIDEQQGTKNTAETLTITKAPPTPPPANPDPNNPPPPAPQWAFTCEPGGPPGANEKINEQPVNEAMNALRSLKIVGVRPKPEKLVGFFSGDAQKVGLNQFDVGDLSSRGFYVIKGGQFLANEGELTAACDDGVVYKMYFGEVIVASGEALSAGSESAGSAKPEAGKDAAAAKKDAKGTEARYMFVTASFDESQIEPAPVAPTAPVAPPEPAGPTAAEAAKDGAPAATQPKTPEQQSYEVAKAAYDQAKTEYDQKVAARNARIEAGKKRADQLRRNFANWYYVIDASSFDKLRPSRAQLVKPPEPAPAAGATPGAPNALGTMPMPAH